jgi:predicted amidohydrolase YtcJ
LALRARDRRSANRETLNLYESAFNRHPDKSSKALRWRVEHAQHISAADIPRFGRLGVIASMEGIHCTSDAPYVLARLGPKRAEEGAYVWQKLMKSGAIIANGTDAPVEDVDPIPSFYASVSRRVKDGSVFFPDQRMSRMEALRSYTINAAFAGFDESNRGSLSRKCADITCSRRISSRCRRTRSLPRRSSTRSWAARFSTRSR